MKRINMFVAVAALMAVMFLVSAAVAFAVPDPTDPKNRCKGDFLAVAGLDELGEPTILFTNQGQCVSFVEGGGTVVFIEETTE